MLQKAADCPARLALRGRQDHCGRDAPFLREAVSDLRPEGAFLPNSWTQKAVPPLRSYSPNGLMPATVFSFTNSLFADGCSKTGSPISSTLLTALIPMLLLKAATMPSKL